MSHDSQRGDISSVRTEKPVVFLDYGELIMHYDFNQQTLERAHKLALSHIKSQGGWVTLDGINSLREAHNFAIKEYLDARNYDNREWEMNTIMAILLHKLGVESIVSRESLADIYMHNDHDISPMPTTLESIPKLSKRARLGIISNLPHDSLKYELASYGLKGKFDPIVISHEVGYRKPHPTIYEEALRRANISDPTQVTFFSHEQIEVDGAKAIGMQGYLAKNLGEVLTKLQASSR